MRPEVVIIPVDAVDEKFVEITREILQREIDRVPAVLWDRACEDIIKIGKISDSTKSKIRRMLGLPDVEG